MNKATQYTRLNTLASDVKQFMDFKGLFESFPFAILLIDELGVIRYSNRSCEELFGYCQGELADVPLFQLQPHMSTQERVSPQALALLSELTGSIETLLQRKDGGQFPGTIRSHQFENEGQSNFRVLMFENSTESKMRESSRILDKLDAERETQEKTQFVSIMSHEIRTPIQGTIGALELLSRTSLTAEQKNYLMLAKNSSQSLLAIVNDILDIASLEADSLNLELEKVDLFELLDKLHELNRSYCVEKENELLLRIDKTVPRYIQADSFRLTQILSNFISNAIKYTDRGLIRVSVSVSTVGKLTFRIDDNGRGVDPQLRGRLFTAHAKGKQTNSKYGSSGLGLAISKRIAEIMEGEVGYEPLSDGGSSFWLAFSLKGAEYIPANIGQDALTYVFAERAFGDNIVDQMHQWNNEVNIWSAAQFNLAQIELPSVGDLRIVIDGTTHTKKQLIRDLQSLHELSLDASERCKISVLIFGLCDLGVDFTSHECFDLCFCPATYSCSHLFQFLCCGFVEENGANLNTANEKCLDGVTILLAEDSLANIEIFSSLIQGRGAKVICAMDGAEAVEQYQKSPVDIVLLDLQMPVMDGYEALKNIQESRDEHDNTPILAMTAFAVGDVVEHCLNAGFDGYISKPVEMDELVSTVLKKLQRPVERGTDVDVSKEPDEKIECVSDQLESIIDIDYLNRQFRSLRKHSVAKMVDLYLNETASRIEDIGDACRKSDFKQLIGETHVLKSSSGTFGASALSELAKAMEAASYDEDIDECHRLEQQIDGLFQRTEGELRSYCQELDRGRGGASSKEAPLRN